MAVIANNVEQIIVRVKADREAIGFALQDNAGDAEDMSGKTATVSLIDVTDHTAHVSGESTSWTTQASGKGSWTPSVAAVGTVGTFAIYFIDDSTQPRRWPYDGAKLKLRVIDAGDE